VVVAVLPVVARRGIVVLAPIQAVPALLALLLLPVILATLAHQAALAIVVEAIIGVAAL
jgi:hypothetical protein